MPRLPQIIKLSEDAIQWREVEGEIVALDLRSSTYLGVNPSGAVLWSDLVNGTSVDNLVNKLAAAFNVERDAATQDVRAFLDELERRGLLEAAPRGESP